MDVIKKWVTEKLTEALGFEEEVTIGMIINQLESVCMYVCMYVCRRVCRLLLLQFLTRCVWWSHRFMYVYMYIQDADAKKLQLQVSEFIGKNKVCRYLMYVFR